MLKKTIIFQEYGKTTYREIDELFNFTIKYHNKLDNHNITKESEFVIVAACRGLTKISLERINQKEYLFISDDISNDVSYPKQIDTFLSMQCDKSNMVTAEMLYHAILDSTDDLFPKMRLCDIYYNYRWLNNKRTDRYIGDEGLPNIDRNIVPRLNIYTNHFDKYIKDFFPNSKNIVINKITSCFNLSQLEAMILFERWKTFYFIEYGPYDEWSQMKPKDTLTIEQFKERLSISKIKIKKDTNTGLLYLEGSEIFIGLVLGNEMPQHPMISQFISSDSKTYWLLHEEGEIQALSVRCVF